jgi:hypothetical protein
LLFWQGLKNVICFVSFRFLALDFRFVSFPFVSEKISFRFCFKPLKTNIYFMCHLQALEEPRRLAFKKTMSDSKVPKFLARSEEKMNFTIEKSRLTLTRVAGVVNKICACGSKKPIFCIFPGLQKTRCFSIKTTVAKKTREHSYT